MEQLSEQSAPLTAAEMACLRALAFDTRPNGEQCLPFKPVMERTYYDRNLVRQSVRNLAGRGFAQYWRGLFNESTGEPAGAGYCISDDGVSWLRDYDEKVSSTLKAYPVRPQKGAAILATLILGHNIDLQQADIKAALQGMIIGEQTANFDLDDVQEAVEAITGTCAAEELYAQGIILGEKGEIEYYSLLEDTPTAEGRHAIPCVCRAFDEHAVPVTSIVWPNSIREKFQHLLGPIQ